MLLGCEMLMEILAFDDTVFKKSKRLTGSYLLSFSTVIYIFCITDESYAYSCRRLEMKISEAECNGDKTVFIGAILGFENYEYVVQYIKHQRECWSQKSKHREQCLKNAREPSFSNARRLI